jgi:hypothetical protein
MLLYHHRDKPSLKKSFPGVDRIRRNYAQACQDFFALTMLNGKRGGTYLEIGSSDPVFINNTYLLEAQFDWRGVSIDIQPEHQRAFQQKRKNAFILANALEVDYASLLPSYGFANRIDYLSLDIEPKTQTLACLRLLLLTPHRFSVITYETDFYDDSEGREVAEATRAASRTLFSDHGYELVVGNVCNTGSSDPFEDWYVDPSFVDPEALLALKSSPELNRPGKTVLLSQSK